MCSPVFIIAMERSGSSLLRVILNEHPEIAALPETHFFPRIHKIFQTISDLEERTRDLLAFLLNNPWFRQLELPVDKIEAITNFITNNPEDEKGFLNLIFSSYANKWGKEKWVEKTPLYSLYWKEILEIFPEAKIITLVRDPFGYCSSMLNAKWYKIRPSLYFLVKRWKEYKSSINSLIIILNKKNNDNIQITYQEFITNPDKYIGSIQKLLNVKNISLSKLTNYHQNLNKHYSKEHLAIGHHSRLLNKIDPNIAHEWRKKLKPWQISYIAKKTGENPSFIYSTSIFDFFYIYLEIIYGILFWNNLSEKLIRKKIK